MTLTHERATDIRRTHKDSLEYAMFPFLEPLHDIDEDTWERHSVKQWFGFLCAGTLLAHANKFELVQFAYDFQLWSMLGAKRTMAKALMRIMTAGFSFTPLNWKRDCSVFS